MLVAINDVALCESGYNFDGWLSADRWTVLVCNQPPKSSRTSIPWGR